MSLFSTSANYFSSCYESAKGCVTNTTKAVSVALPIAATTIGGAVPGGIFGFTCFQSVAAWSATAHAVSSAPIVKLVASALYFHPTLCLAGAVGSFALAGAVLAINSYQESKRKDMEIEHLKGIDDAREKKSDAKEAQDDALKKYEAAEKEGDQNKIAESRNILLEAEKLYQAAKDEYNSVRDKEVKVDGMLDSVIAAGSALVEAVKVPVFLVGGVGYGVAGCAEGVYKAFTASDHEALPEQESLLLPDDLESQNNYKLNNHGVELNNHDVPTVGLDSHQTEAGDA